MPGQSDQTVVRIINAAARRFADDSWRGADLADVLADAGVDDETAITYNFGCREGLLLEVVGRTLWAMEAYRREDTEQLSEESSVHDLVSAVMRPFTELLKDPSHRDGIRLLGQFAGDVDVAKGVGVGPVEGLVVEEQYRLLTVAASRVLGDEALARERVRWFAALSTTALSTRGDELTRWLDAVGGTEADADTAARVHGRQSHEVFAADLARQLTAALLAPAV